jgi:hypothetical protein
VEIYRESVDGVVRSKEAEVKVNGGDGPGFVITQQPQGGEVEEGGNITIQVGLEVRDASLSEKDIAYQWFRNGEPLNGETGQFLVLIDLAVHESGVYWVEVLRKDTSEALRSNSADLQVQKGPHLEIVIEEHPLSEIVSSGSSFSLSVKYTPSIGVDVQWYHDGEPIEGATFDRLTIENANPGQHGGQYFAIIETEGNSVESLKAKITVEELPEGWRIVPIFESRGVFTLDFERLNISHLDSVGKSPIPNPGYGIFIFPPSGGGLIDSARRRMPFPSDYVEKIKAAVNNTPKFERITRLEGLSSELLQIGMLTIQVDYGNPFSSGGIGSDDTSWWASSRVSEYIRTLNQNGNADWPSADRSAELFHSIVEGNYYKYSSPSNHPWSRKGNTSFLSIDPESAYPKEFGLAARYGHGGSKAPFGFHNYPYRIKIFARVAPISLTPLYLNKPDSWFINELNALFVEP